MSSFARVYTRRRLHHWLIASLLTLCSNPHVRHNVPYAASVYQRHELSSRTAAAAFLPKFCSKLASDLECWEPQVRWNESRCLPFQKAEKVLCRRIGLQTFKRNIFAKLSQLDVCKHSSASLLSHVAKENHVVNWSGAKILEREGHRKTRQVKESIWIRKEPACMNRDGGAYSLPTAYDRLLVTCSTSTSRDHKPDEARRWRAKRRN